MTQRTSRSKRTLISLAVAGGIIAGALAMSFPGIASGSSIANKNVQIVNLSDQSFGVIWTTPTVEKNSSMDYGTSCSAATTPVTEVSGNGRSHLVNSPGNLEANTTYYFKLVVGGVTDTNGGKCYQAHTFTQQTVPPAPAAALGFVKTAGCSAAQSGALVVLTLTYGGKTSMPLATMSSSTGIWALPMGDTTTSTGGYVPLAKGDAVQAHVYRASGNVSSVSTSYNGSAQTLELQAVCAA